MRPKHLAAGQVWRRKNGTSYLVVSMDTQITIINSIDDVQCLGGSWEGSHVEPKTTDTYIGMCTGYYVSKVNTHTKAN